MSMGPLGGVVGSVAGAPLSQTKGASEERSSRDAATQEKTDELDLRAERSSGIGQTESDQQASDRDADGRRLWEQTAGEQRGEQEQDQPAEQQVDEQNDEPDDAGGRLDLIA